MLVLNFNILKNIEGQFRESFYLLDTIKFEENFDYFLEAHRSIYPKTYIGYSYKTNYTPKLCSIVNKKGGYAEVVSEMEYDLVIRIGVLPENIIVNGPYKNKVIAMTSGSKFNMGLLSSSVNMPMQVYGVSENKVKYKSIDISGYTCIEKDYLYRDYNGELAKGDFVVFDNVGSYSVVFKSPFILPNVPVIEQTTGEVLKRQEKMSDIFSTFIF